MYADDFYPEKPALQESKAKGNLALTIFSILLFVMTFLLFFAEEVNFVFQVVIVLLIHELGHFLLMKLFQYKHVRMLFIPLMGAFVQGSKERYSQRQSLLVSAAGPIPGIILGLVVISIAFGNRSIWLVDLGLLFLLLNTINLFPLDPLDGGQLFKLMVLRNQDMYIMVFSFVSSLILIGFGWFIQSWMMVVFGFLMGFRVRSLQNQFHLRKELEEEGVLYRSTYTDLSNKDFHKIKAVLMERTPALKTFVEQSEPEVSDPILASQVNAVLLSPVDQDATLGFKLFVGGIWVAALAVPIGLFIYFNEAIMESYGWYFKYLSSK
jgi:stage IV sporulation protein FB